MTDPAWFWPGMSADQFETAYAANSGVSVQWLHEHGRRARRCECGDSLCVGWMMAHDE